MRRSPSGCSTSSRRELPSRARPLPSRSLRRAAAMRHHVVMKRWILIAAVALLLSGAAKSIEDRSRSPLAGVKALENPVSYTETKIPLGELVQKVAADTGAPLTAAPEVA